MYYRPITQAKRPAQRKSEMRKYAAPTAGWISNRNLASPLTQAGDQGQGAAVLDNFFPTSTTALLRRGKSLYATLGDGTQNVTSIFSYVNGLNRRLFASTETTIYDITTVEIPYNYRIVDSNSDYIVNSDGNYFGSMSTQDRDVFSGALGGDWVTVQFATTGGVYLIGVNGESEGFIYDGLNMYPYIAGGYWALSYGSVTTDFQVGEVVTGGTSGATGTVYEVLSGGGLILSGVTGTFENLEPLTGSMGGEAVSNSTQENVVPGITFPDSLTTADMSYVWVYRNRIWFVQKDSLNIWYMDAPDAIGGSPKVYPMGGIFTWGGSVLWGASWSFESGAAGGLSDQMVVTSTEGEVAVFQGLYPEAANQWTIVGVYIVGSPLGKRAFFRGGGDIAIATSVGLVPLSKAISLDVNALSPATVSYNIQDAWQQAIEERGLNDWQCEIWPEKKMAVISPPSPIGSSDPVLFISNTETGAWCRFTNWDARAMDVFQGVMYFGGAGGDVYIANATGADNGEVYTGVYIPLFDDFGLPANKKVPKMGRGNTRSKNKVISSIRFKGDFDISTGAAPSATPVNAPNSWGRGTWGASVWGATLPTVVNNEWKSVGGLGYYMSMCYQVTSGDLVPLDVEIIDLEMTYTTAEMVT